MSHKNDKDESESASSSSSDSKKKNSKHKNKKEKKVKKGTGKKRGPRGPQWKSWKEPYQPGSITNRLAKEMRQKGGMKAKDFVSKCKKMGGNPAFMLRVISRGETKGFKWEFDDSNNRYRILNVRKDAKAW